MVQSARHTTCYRIHVFEGTQAVTVPLSLGHFTGLQSLGIGQVHVQTCILPSFGLTSPPIDIDSVASLLDTFLALPSPDPQLTLDLYSPVFLSLPEFAIDIVLKIIKIFDDAIAPISIDFSACSFAEEGSFGALHVFFLGSWRSWNLALVWERGNKIKL